MLWRAGGKGGKVCLKRHFTVQCSTQGLLGELQDMPHIAPLCVWPPDVHGHYAENPSSWVIKCPFLPQCSHFFTLESPALPKAQANHTRTQVMATPRMCGFRHRLPASYQCKTLGVQFPLQKEQAGRTACFPLAWGTALQLQEVVNKGKLRKQQVQNCHHFPIRGHGILRVVQTELKHVSVW